MLSMWLNSKKGFKSIVLWNQQQVNMKCLMSQRCQFPFLGLIFGLITTLFLNYINTIPVFPHLWSKQLKKFQDYQRNNIANWNTRLNNKPTLRIGVNYLWVIVLVNNEWKSVWGSMVNMHWLVNTLLLKAASAGPVFSPIIYQRSWAAQYISQ